MPYFNQKRSYYKISVLEQPKEMCFQAILKVGILFYKLVFIVKPTEHYCGYNLCCFYVKNEKIRNYYTEHSSIILSAYFTTLMHSKNCKNAVLCFSITYAKHW